MATHPRAPDPGVTRHFKTSRFDLILHAAGTRLACPHRNVAEHNNGIVLTDGTAAASLLRLGPSFYTIGIPQTTGATGFRLQANHA